jgi:membrane-bound metal-dependent hydrolase YbcI (DUF457 family)
MYRLGHTGIALLVLAPLSYGLLEAHRPLLALIISLGVLAIEPLPDYDFKLPFLDHRGVSHSLFAAVAIGGFLALCGWFVGMQGVTLLTSILGVTTEIVTTVATSLESLALPETTGSIVAWIVGLLTEVVANLDWIVSQLQMLDRETIAGVGFVIGAGGILVHLLGDVLTVSGIRPLLPFSQRQLSVSSLHAKSTLANTGLFTVGVLAVAVVLAMTVAGIGVAVVPADLSPVGVAAGQQTQPQNATNATATVVFQNQTTNGTAVTISSAMLSEGGFIAIHGPGYVRQGVVTPSTITVSRYLPPGTYHNITVQFDRGVPGAVSNISEFSGAYGPLSAVLYRDTNGNHQFDYVETIGQNDTIYRRNGTRVDDQARVVTEEQLDRKTQPTATITFTNQSVADGTLTVKRVSLPEGGFVVVHDARYLRGNNPFKSAIGLSRYLPPGTHHNVSIALVNGTVQHDQSLVAVAYRDTNSNQTYDYVRSGGMADYGYVTRSGPNATLVTDRAYVSVSSPTTTPTHTPPPTTMAASRTPTQSSPPASGGFLSGLLSGVSLLLIAAVLAVIAAIGLVLTGRRS